jgi:hypothetical protein
MLGRLKINRQRLGPLLVDKRVKSQRGTVFPMRQSPHCNEHYACACYTNEIARLRARLTELEVELRKLRRLAGMPRQAEGSKRKGNPEQTL